MIPLRVLVVTDRFWPVVDADALALEQMCRALSRRGHRLRVLTRSWQKYWSPALTIGEIDVVRLAFSPRSRFGNARLARHLSHWLELHRDEIDLLLVDPLCEWSPTTVQFAARHEVPVCLWQASATSSSTWSAAWTKLRRSVPAIKAHAAWILPDAQCADQVRLAGADSRRILVLGPSIDCEPDLELTKSAARLALADNHPTMLVAPDEILVVSVGIWNSARPAIIWVDAWRQIRQSIPCAKLWLIGSGSEIPKIEEHIRQRQLSDEVLIAGSFDDLSDVLRAADLLIQTESSAAIPFATLAAMRYGLPVLANTSDRPADFWLRAGGNGFEYTPSEPRQLAAQLIEILEQHAAREAIAERAQQFVLQHHPLDQAAIRLERLGRDLVEHREKVQS